MHIENSWLSEAVDRTYLNNLSSVISKISFEKIPNKKRLTTPIRKGPTQHTAHISQEEKDRVSLKYNQLHS